MSVEEQVPAEPIAETRLRYDYDDYKAYCRFWRRREGLPHLIRAVILFALLAAANVWWISRCFYYGEFPLWFPLLSALLAAGVLLPIPLRQRQKFKRMEPEREYTVTFYEDRVCIVYCTPEQSESYSTQYSRYTGAEETADMFYLRRPGKRAGYVLYPKHCLTPEQQQALRALLAARFGEKFCDATKHTKGDSDQ